MDIVEYLLANYVEVNIKDRWGSTPLKEACDNNYLEIGNLLHNNKAKLLMTSVEECQKLC